jgi:LPS export ABC transporter protein LptC
MMALMRNPAFIALMCLPLAACNGPTTPVTSNYQQLPADQVMYGMEHNMSNGGIRTAHLKADTALMYNDSSALQLRVVDLDVFTEQGVVRAELTSQKGELDQTTNRMVARGNVVLVVKGENGRTIYTEELHYDPNQKQIWSDVKIRQVFPDGRENTATSFRADDQFKNFTAQNVTGSAGVIRF